MILSVYFTHTQTGTNLENKHGCDLLLKIDRCTSTYVISKYAFNGYAFDQIKFFFLRNRDNRCYVKVHCSNLYHSTVKWRLNESISYHAPAPVRAINIFTSIFFSYSIRQCYSTSLQIRTILYVQCSHAMILLWKTF